MNPEKVRRLLVRNDGSHCESPPAECASPRPADAELFDAPAYKFGLGDPVIVERLELLDDTVFEAIAGKAAAVEQLRRLWPKTLHLVGRELADESRQAYLQHALKRWHECAEGGETRNPKLAIALMEVLSILLGS